MSKTRLQLKLNELSNIFENTPTSFSSGSSTLESSTLCELTKNIGDLSLGILSTEKKSPVLKNLPDFSEYDKHKLIVEPAPSRIRLEPTITAFLTPASSPCASSRRRPMSCNLSPIAYRPTLEVVLEDGTESQLDNCNMALSSLCLTGPSFATTSRPTRVSSAFIKRLTRHRLSAEPATARILWDIPLDASPETALLSLCGKKKLLTFSKYFPPKTRRTLQKIGEGCFAEVFRLGRLSGTVLKMIPVEGAVSFNGAEQKRVREVFSEVFVSRQLSNLHKASPRGLRDHCNGFVRLLNLTALRGAFPAYLQRVWEKFDAEKGSENDHPSRFPASQLWLACETEFSGRPLEDRVPRCPRARLAVWAQAAIALAVAEAELRFEHRDLHWGNILLEDPPLITEAHVCPFCQGSSQQSQQTFRIHGKDYQMPTYHSKTVIIDFTLSRLDVPEKGTVFLDLSRDPELFECEGDYQFEIYRKMRAITQDRWESFTPKTNVAWLHYLIDKLLQDQSRSPCDVGGKVMAQLQEMYSTCLQFDSAVQLVTESNLFSFAGVVQLQL